MGSFWAAKIQQGKSLFTLPSDNARAGRLIISVSQTLLDEFYNHKLYTCMAHQQYTIRCIVINCNVVFLICIGYSCLLVIAVSLIFS